MGDLVPLEYARKTAGWRVKTICAVVGALLALVPAAGGILVAAVLAWNGADWVSVRRAVWGGIIYTALISPFVVREWLTEVSLVWEKARLAASSASESNRRPIAIGFGAVVAADAIMLACGLATTLAWAIVEVFPWLLFLTPVGIGLSLFGRMVMWRLTWVQKRDAWSRPADDGSAR